MTVFFVQNAYYILASIHLFRLQTVLHWLQTPGNGYKR